MPNNPIRFRRDYEAAYAGQRTMKRKDVATTVRTVNKVFVAAGTELGSPNGGPAPVYSGGGAGGDLGGTER